MDCFYCNNFIKVGNNIMMVIFIQGSKQEKRGK